MIDTHILLNPKLIIKQNLWQNMLTRILYVKIGVIDTPVLKKHCRQHSLLKICMIILAFRNYWIYDNPMDQHNYIIFELRNICLEVKKQIIKNIHVRKTLIFIYGLTNRFQFSMYNVLVPFSVSKYHVLQSYILK